MEVHYIDNDVDENATKAEIYKMRVHCAVKIEIDWLINHYEYTWEIKEKGKWDLFSVANKNYLSKDILDEHNIPKVGQIDLLDLKVKYNLLSNKIREIKHRAEELDMIKEADEDENTLEERIERLLKIMDYGYHLIWLNYHDHTLRNEPRKEISYFGEDLAQKDKNENENSFQKAIRAVLKQMYRDNIRRYKGNCFEEIKTPEGYQTRAWKQKATIQNYVHEIANKDGAGYELWYHLTSRGSCFKDVMNHLTYCRDPQFPEITKNRYVWSFKNGIFIGREWNLASGKYETRFYDYESKEFKCLNPLTVSCKYFEKDFNNYDHIDKWYDIPTPHFQSILDYQKFSPEVCKWMYVMGGRLCFDVNDMDSWQIIPFLKGIAKSGKSTVITKVFKKFYEAEDVRTLSNNVEKKFGLSSIFDAFMFIAPEVKGDLALEQAEFQSLVSGEDVSIAVKHEKARSFEWKTPGILGGNEVPNWRDNSGSVLRRLLTWDFNKQVKDADPTLDDKLEEEIPIILLKCVKGYLEYSQKFKNKDIWNVTPQYFKTIQKQVAMVASTLHNFMESSGVVYGEDMCCPQKIFVQLFNQHCAANNLGKPRFNQDFYAGPFSSRDIEVREEARTYKGRAYPRQPFIFGLDVVDETQQFTSDF